MNRNPDSIGLFFNQLKNLTSLRFLDLNYNALHGPFTDLMTGLSHLPALQYLTMNQNVIYGDLSDQPAVCDTVALRTSHMTKLGLTSNALTGTSIPACVYDVPGLEALELGNNQLSGDIGGPPPTPRSNLKSLYLGQQRPPVDSVASISLTGTLFPFLDRAPNLMYYEADYCSLTGSVPAVPSSLMIFSLYDNQLHGASSLSGQ